MKICLIACAFLLLFGEVYSQHDISDSKLAFDQLIEELLPIQEDDADYSKLYDRLFSLYQEPVDLNRATYKQLQALYFLSDWQIGNFLDYRSEYGRLYSIYELNAVAGFDWETIRKIVPFVTVIRESEHQLSFAKSLKYSQINQLIIGFHQGLEDKKGYSGPDTLSNGQITSRYAGGPARYNLRWNYSRSGYYSFGLVMEKDPGEQFVWNSRHHQFGMDYYAFHAMLENRGLVKKLIMGNYSLDYGQGLVLGSGLWVGKGVEAINTVRRSGLGLRPYKSVYEYTDFSGLALTLGGERFNVTGFYSNQNRDATVRVEDGLKYVSALKATGLHRTPTEIASKSSNKERSFGMNLDFSSKSGRANAGLNAIFTRYQMPIIPIENNYNGYYFTGSTNYAGSVYGNYVFSNINIFGEAGISKGGGCGAVGGMIMSINSTVQTALLWRNYTRDFHAMHSMAFRENSRTSNEQGIYWGVKIQPLSRLKFNFFVDSFRFPWLRYRVDAPSQGYEIMSNGEWIVSQNLTFKMQYRQKTKSLNHNSGDDPINKVLPGTKRYCKLQMIFLSDEGISLNTRLQFGSYHFSGNNTSGFLVAQDINFHQRHWYVAGRFALFDTDGYDTRQFVYENDVLYAFSVPFFQGRGSRVYLLGRCDLNAHISCWLKYGKTIYEDVDVIGSGLEEISGNEKSSLSALLRYRF